MPKTSDLVVKTLIEAGVKKAVYLARARNYLDASGLF